MIALTFLILINFTLLFAPAEKCLYIQGGEVINPYEIIWQAVCEVESGGDTKAVGDKHLKDYSYGIAQIRKSRLDDFKKRTGINYSLVDMYCPKKSKSVWMYYADEIGPYDYERICREWNGGNKGMQKESTKKYYLKIQKVMLSL